MKNKKKIREYGIRALDSLAVAVLAVLLAVSGLLNAPGGWLEDALYQRGDDPDERIAIVGIDAYALKKYGSWPWDRSVIAEVIETLNQDEENRPAAIGLDVLYAGTTNSESDEQIAKAASAGNVAVAGMVEFGQGLARDKERNLYLTNMAVRNPSLPFQDLRKEARVGHINAMYDSDGVLRHHIWSLKLPNGDTLLSLPYALYSLYCEANGMEADFRPATDQNSFWWVDYSGSPGDYYYCSVADILEGSYDPDILADSIELIGPYDAAMADSFVTAADHAEQMYGVEYLANVTADMLNGVQKQEAGRWVQLTFLFVLTLFITFLLLGMNPGWSALFGVASIVCGIAAAVGLYEKGTVIHVLWFAGGAVLALALSFAVRYVGVILEKRRVTRTFGRYVDPAIIKELLEGDKESLELTGKLRNIAVLFVDIRGFTTLSEQLTPEQIVKILNEYLTLTSRCIRNQRGTLDKFVGDCTMAFWGAPIACEDPVGNACRAALEMEAGAKELGMRVEEKFGKTISFGVGVHYGPAVVGNIGSPERMDYTAIGDTVNTASRLESNAPAGTVYISRLVADMLGERAVTETLDHKLKLKGKAEGFEVLILKGMKE